MIKYIFWVLVLLAVVVCCHAMCSGQQRPYEYFGTKTLYQKVNGKLPLKKSRAPKGCSPVFVFGLIRHGARLASSEIVPELEELLELAKKINSTGKAQLCKKDIEELRNWKVWANKYANRNLTEYGAEEMRGIAKRYRNLLPELLNASNTGNHRYFSSNFSRTVDSMMAFTSVLGTSPSTNPDAYTVVPNNESSFRNDNCPKYVRDVDDNPHVEEEYESFFAGPYIRRVKRKVARRLGIRHSEMSGDLLWLIYSSGCYYQQWVDVKEDVAPWCRVFSRRDLKIMEYASDLEDYAQRSFQSDIAFKWTCAIAKDVVGAIVNASENHLEGNFQPTARLIFGHSSTVAVTAANMGLYEREDPPTSENFRYQKYRAFRMSQMTPSAGNIMIVLYQCSAQDESTYKVQTFWNERLLRGYPACRSTGPIGMCDLDTWLESYHQFVPGSETECSMEEICSV
uniref:Multiple inositol polyphosphate phosphatase 1 n=1 Tax=Phallusia mammillata TaxID=59560 RepID=A0A6F9DK57_9ASCI|nr:multiple inositol polyphosphate phosphatase 1-like [Phallusia mammillata]